ncbi:efa1/LifA-like domain protein [Escherichia coli DEC5B]|nr:efa1/LifA-like domain protein [Escherichia coli DEC5B]
MEVVVIRCLFWFLLQNTLKTNLRRSKQNYFWKIYIQQQRY